MLHVSIILNGSTVMNTVFYSFEYFADSELVKKREGGREHEIETISLFSCRV